MMLIGDLRYIGKEKGEVLTF